MTKQCSKCNEVKPLAEFYKDKSKNDGYRTECKSCKKMYARGFRKTEEYKVWKRENSKAYYHNIYKHDDAYKIREKRRRVKRDYGITLEEYSKHLDSPCDICGGEAKHLDHCHITGKVRGLLCIDCNTILGYSKDNINILKRAIRYLQKEGIV